MPITNWKDGMREAVEERNLHASVWVNFKRWILGAIND